LSHFVANINLGVSVDKDERELADRFRSLREKTGLSQKDFAQTIGLSHTVIAEIERGAREPSRKVMVALSEKYNISLDWLLLGVGGPKLDAHGPEDWAGEIADLEEKIKSLEVKNNQLTSELLERMRQIVDLQGEKLGTA
jgi:transcriptional regulator with XRE-family HTH domain